MKRWICQICNKSFINKFCGELKIFIRDSTLCETCKLTNNTKVIHGNVLFESSASSSFSKTLNGLSKSHIFKKAKVSTKRSLIKKSIETTYDSSLLESFQDLFGSGKELNQKIIVQCNDISNNFNNYYVRTSLEEISRIIKKIEPRPLDEIKRVFATCLREILQYDNNTLQLHCRTNSPEWKYWCSDVVIYFICRKILFNKSIPICQENQETP